MNALSTIFDDLLNNSARFFEKSRVIQQSEAFGTPQMLKNSQVGERYAKCAYYDASLNALIAKNRKTVTNYLQILDENGGL